MMRPEVSTLHCPICIYDGEEQEGTDDENDEKDQQNNNRRNTNTSASFSSLNSSIVVQMSWSCSRSGMAYLLTEDGGLSLSVWMDEEEDENENEKFQSTTTPIKNIKKQLLPPFTLHQGLTMFVTSMRDFSQIEEMKKQREDPIKSMNDHFAVPPLTWQLSQVV